MSPEIRGADTVVADMTFPCCPMHELWENSPARFLAELDNYAAAGVKLVSITVGLDHFPDISFQIREIGRYRAALSSAPDKYALVTTAGEIRRAKADGKLAVALHFQGTNMLQGDLNLVDVYKALGISHMLLAYNDKNAVGDGCHERTDAGLSNFGFRLIEKMNASGVIVDLTHTGERTTLDAAEASTAPVIYSHSSCKAVYAHDRNISDAQIKSCAATGGVICVHGVGIFMSDAGDDISAAIICQHIDHIVQLTGPEHVGIGLDYVADTEALVRLLNANKGRYAAGANYDRQEFHFAAPAVIGEIAEHLLASNYAEDQVRGILGENVMRVFETVCG